MQRGYVLCKPGCRQVVSLSNGKIVWLDADNTKNLNRAMCLHDLTEAKNVSKRFQEQALTADVEIVNVAKLYNQLY